MMRRLLFPAALVLLSLAPARAADEPGPPADPLRSDLVLARQFHAAYRAGDDAAMDALAAKTFWPHLEPHLVARDLLALHAAARLAEPPRDGDYLGAARALAERVRGKPGNGSLPGLVAGWADLGAEALRREARVAAAIDRILLALHRGAPEECAAEVPDYEALAVEAAPSLGAAILGSLLAQRLAAARLPRESVTAFRQAAAAAAAVPWPAGRCGSLWAAGRESFRCGDVREARSLWEEELALQEQAGDRAGEVETLMNVAAALRTLGETAAAGDAAERALRAAEEGVDGFAIARARHLAADLQARRGDCAGALPRLEEALRSYREVCSSEIGEAGALASIARVYADLGLPRRALPAIQRAMAVVDGMRGLDLAEARARLRGRMAEVLAGLGRRGEAAALQEQAWRDLEARGNRPAAAEALAGLGRLLLDGDPGRAADLLGKALREMEAMGNRPGAARARADLGRALAAAGDGDGALRLLEAARGEAESLGDPLATARIVAAMASVRRTQGQPRDALRLARAAVEASLSLGAGLGEEESEGLGGAARDAADPGLLAARDLLLRPDGDAADPGAEAFWLVEASRARALADGIVNRDALLAATVPAALRDEEAAARDRVAALRREMAERARTAGEDVKALVALRADLDAAYRSLEAAASRVQREARRVGDLVYPRPVALADLQASLDPGTALALFHLTPEAALAVVVTHEGVRLVDLGSAGDLVAAARSYVDLASVEGSADEGAAAALYRRLLLPLEPETLGCDRVLISPDGVLAFLPFEALLRVEGDRRERVVERWEIAYVPSATVYAFLRDEWARAGAPGRGLVALGDPVLPGEGAAPAGQAFRRFAGLRRLPGTAAEVRSIGDAFPAAERTLLLRDGATLPALGAALRAAPGRLAALHIACHGVVDAERPRLTGLVLGGGEVVSVDDIYRMQVPADLVVLSACDSGRGEVLRGEGVLGLARAFFFAGAPRVVVSDWAVSDEATRALMGSFYRRMVREGLSPGRALRAAKIERLRSGGPAAHPAHWAAFVLWGTDR